MEIHKVIIVTVLAMSVFPAFVAFMSFVMWKNEFKELGMAYISRMSLGLTALLWVIVLIPGGAK
ncbi:hypothetical protein PUG46_19430 [Erwiniaceae bacterium L1_55_4]|nr:hypothetical protein [Erwiniaceae bacterium L1_55_4]